MTNICKLLPPHHFTFPIWFCIWPLLQPETCLLNYPASSKATLTVQTQLNNILTQ